ncbi:MAG: MerR family transcriptional regulator [Bacteroidota bacterium]|nr:MerR family transcriptional regulator [Bacteroidota bacterium]
MSEKTYIPLSNEPIYSIGTAADSVGLSVQMLRLYEAEGLVLPFKKSSLHRLYSEADIERILCIRKMINEEKISIVGIKRMLALIPCWAIKNCPKEERENCKAFTDHTQPCWLQKETFNGCDNSACRLCPVYEKVSNCASLKQILNQVEHIEL